VDVNIVKKKRRALRIPSFRSGTSPWTPEFLSLLGKIPDTKLAKKMGTNVTSVAKKRWKLGMKPCVQYFKWTRPRVALLGTAPDSAIADRLGLS
jgi:hypothetical protein